MIYMTLIIHYTVHMYVYHAAGYLVWSAVTVFLNTLGKVAYLVANCASLLLTIALFKEMYLIQYIPMLSSISSNTYQTLVLLPK